MLKNHFKVAFRYLKSHPSFAIINVLGLTLGFFCFFLLNSYVLKEKSFDKNQERVYRLLQKTTNKNGRVLETAKAPPKVGTESKRIFDEIENQTHIFYMGRRNIGNDPKNVTHQEIAILDNNFLQVFNFPLLEGSANILSDNPNGFILTQSTKELYFGKEPALGKLLKINEEEYPVVGVLNDFPENSHLENLVFLSYQMATGIFEWFDDFMTSNWSNSQPVTYFKVLPDTDMALLGQKITTLAQENYPENRQFNSTYSLQPVQDIHLYNNEVQGEINKNKGNSLYVNLFFWVSILILLAACFNYAGLLNIAFIDRSKEIGLRQIVGAKKSHLLRQFIAESLLLISTSMLLAYTFLWVLQPLVQKWFSTSLTLTEVPLMGMIFILISGLVIGLLSVGYPFWTIIRSRKSSALRNTLAVGSKLPFRRVMLTFQFIAVICFITASVVFRHQMNFLESKELGFEKEGLVTVDINSGILRKQFQAIKTEFLRIPEVTAVTASSRVPGEWKTIPIAKAKRAGQDISESEDMLFFGVDEHFLETYNITLLEGVNFDGTPNDSTKVLINEAAALALGLDAAVGQYIEIPSWNYGGSSGNLSAPFRGQISGIVGNFQIEDFRTNVKPLIIGNWNNPIHPIDYYTLKVATPDWSKTLAALKEVNDSFDPSTSIEINILNDMFLRFFDKDIEHFRLLNFFSVIVIFLSCMGLFAMSAFIVSSRTKEIGIRKVLGSSISELLYLLSKDFLKLILISLLIAAPIAWYLMTEWLLRFAYRIDFAWWALAVAGVACLILTLLTVSFQSLKAAIANPVNSLRTE